MIMDGTIVTYKVNISTLARGYGLLTLFAIRPPWKIWSCAPSRARGQALWKKAAPCRGAADSENLKLKRDWMF